MRDFNDNEIYCSICNSPIQGKAYCDGGVEEIRRLRRDRMPIKEIARREVKFKYFCEECCPIEYKK